MDQENGITSQAQTNQIHNLFNDLETKQIVLFDNVIFMELHNQKVKFQILIKP